MLTIKKTEKSKKKTTKERKNEKRKKTKRRNSMSSISMVSGKLESTQNTYVEEYVCLRICVYGSEKKIDRTRDSV